MKFLTALILLLGTSAPGYSPARTFTDHPTKRAVPPAPRYTSWIVGDTADVSPTPRPGLVLAGGGTDQDEAMRWFLKRANGGDIVIIRASGAAGYNKYLFKELGEKVNSVETLLIDSRQVACDPDVARKLRNAEALFIAGGDQGKYAEYWKDTPVAGAINYLLTQKRVTVGGTSAGCAILSGLYFDAQNGTVTSEEALTNPYDPKVLLHRDDFLKAPFLQNFITDMHFSNRNRQGRLVVFLARAAQDWGLSPKGIGMDEKTALCLDETGAARLYGSGQVYLMEPLTAPTRCQAGQSLDWHPADRRALRVVILRPGGRWNVNTWQGDAKSAHYYVQNGELKTL